MRKSSKEFGSRASLKLLSTSSPAMTAQAQLGGPPTPRPEKPVEVPTTSKSREKKFHRHFPTVEIEEKVLNYYSCAYVGDILLQGHLYITKNYFAFYSNVFGYVTKLLIPMISVEKITKEKTARIIPNAVGIATADEKHVFGTLLSRENTYKYMTKVWNLSQQAMEDMIEAESLANADNMENIVSESDSSETKDMDSEKESLTPSQISSSRLNLNILLDGASQKHKGSNVKFKFIQGYRSFLSMPSHTLVLFAAMFLLIMLFLSATLLLYRISKINDKYLSLVEDHDLSGSDDIYSHLLRFLIHLHSKSAGSMHNYVDSNLQQISKVRQDLEILSSL
ncbi:hypothetical protein WA026_003729 [Henosepilachna vigintioctopunctata]|uniref:GRAM domain-containing protein n=1 Tax=Henosepilachna vigintioctopunctata TaxID=420089 RepID=A0AAW1UFI4_9CUCU